MELYYRSSATGSFSDESSEWISILTRKLSFTLDISFMGLLLDCGLVHDHEHAAGIAPADTPADRREP